jgi:hypothetical protein
LRLGEASGAATALLIMRAALACHTGMATFAEAGVSDKRRTRALSRRQRGSYFPGHPPLAKRVFHCIRGMVVFSMCDVYDTT